MAMKFLCSPNKLSYTCSQREESSAHHSYQYPTFELPMKATEKKKVANQSQSNQHVQNVHKSNPCHSSSGLPRYSHPKGQKDLDMVDPRYKVLDTKFQIPEIHHCGGNQVRLKFGSN